jgi:cytochrome c556
MKTLRIVFALSMGILGGVLLAQTEADFSGWMKQVAKSNGALKGATDAKVVATEAKALEGIFKQVGAYFTSHGMPEAAKLAGDAQANAAKAATAAAGGTIDAAAVTALGGSCAGCHPTYREKGSDGAYKIKGAK